MQYLVTMTTHVPDGVSEAEVDDVAGGDVGALQHPRVVLPMRRRDAADGPDAGDVSGATQVLAAGIDQQQAVAFDHGMGFRAGTIVRHGAVRVVAGEVLGVLVLRRARVTDAAG